MPDVLILTGNVEGGIPPFQPPWLFGLNATGEGGASGDPQSPPLEGPLEIARHLGVGLAMMPLVANLQQLAIAKFYTRKLTECFLYIVGLNVAAHIGVSYCTCSLLIVIKFPSYSLMALL